jgi:hyaluronan synthase
VIPVYNEDPRLLLKRVLSLVRQTRKPSFIHVTDDGSTTSDYRALRHWFTKICRKNGIDYMWVRTENQGKRHAQYEGFRRWQPDVWVTCDSDSQLAPNALEELLKPFKSQKVQSVAGLVCATNNRHNLLARITDLWFVTNQLVDRSALSTLGSVMVNSGPIAAYRTEVIMGGLDLYLNETFMGKPVTFSDDSFLTLLALLKGRTVQQSSAVAFSHMPVKVSHHLRQYLRWMRGSTIRSMWRFKYLPVTSVAYWAHAMRWTQVALSTYALVWVSAHASVTPWFFAVPVAVGAGQTLRYLTIRRSDQSLASQVGIWALTPLAVGWAWLVLRPMRWYGIATCGKTKRWGTREKVEVTA